MPLRVFYDDALNFRMRHAEIQSITTERFVAQM